MTLGALTETSEILSVFVNEKKVEVPRFASVNGVLQSNYYEIREGDAVEILNFYTVGQIAEFMDVALDPHMNLYVNNKLANLDTPVYENFSVLWTMEKLDMPAIDVSADEEDMGTDDRSGVINADAEENSDALAGSDEVADSDNAASGEVMTGQDNAEDEKGETTIQLVVNRSPVTLRGKQSYVYVDVFEAIDFDLSRPRGKGIVTTLNGRAAQYLEPIQSGDVIEIYWQE